MTRLSPEDPLLLALLLLALAVLGLLIYEVRRGEPWDGFPIQDAATEVCTLRLLRDLAATRGLPLNAVDGHGRAYDEAWGLCTQDPLLLEWPSKITPLSILHDAPAEKD